MLAFSMCKGWMVKVWSGERSVLCLGEIDIITIIKRKEEKKCEVADEKWLFGVNIYAQFTHKVR